MSLFALTYPRTAAETEEPVLTDPLTGERYALDEVELPDGLREFLAAMLCETRGSDEPRSAEEPTRP